MRTHSLNIMPAQAKAASFKGTFVVNDKRVIKGSEEYKPYFAEKFDKVIGTYDTKVNEDKVVMKSLSQNDTLVFLQLKQLGVKFSSMINQ